MIRHTPNWAETLGAARHEADLTPAELGNLVGLTGAQVIALEEGPDPACLNILTHYLITAWAGATDCSPHLLHVVADCRACDPAGQGCAHQRHHRILA